jgi:hypothetical protein
MSDETPDSLIPYDEIVQEALRAVVGRVLGEIETTGARHDVPGPSPNPATNLIIHDVALRAGGRLMRHALEKGLLRNRYGRSAKDMIENRSLVQALASYAVARMATRSLPGAVIVGGGLLAKTLFDRGRSRRKNRRDGDKALHKMAED